MPHATTACQQRFKTIDIEKAFRYETLKFEGKHVGLYFYVLLF